MRPGLAIWLTVGALAASAAGAQAVLGSGGYLAGHEPDTIAAVAPPPAPGSARDAADLAIFKATRALEGTARWRLAQNDAILTIPAFLGDFSCAAGARLTEANAPALTRVLRRVAPDIAAAYDRPKSFYKRPRPYLRETGDICVPRSAALAGSWDYPSGHAAFAWTWGLILADLAPERAGQIMGRARAFGESRVVCGVHDASAVAQSRVAAATLFAALPSDPAFRADMDAARRELAALRAAGPAPEAAACAADAAVAARTPW